MKYSCIALSTLFPLSRASQLTSLKSSQCVWPTLDNFFSDYGYTQTYVHTYTCTYMLVYLNACVHVCNQMCLFAGSVYMVSRQNTALETNKGTSWEKLILLSAVTIFLKFFFLSMYGILQYFTPSTLTCSSIMSLLWFGLCSHFWVRLLHSWLPWVLTPTSLLPFYIVPWARGVWAVTWFICWGWDPFSLSVSVFCPVVFCDGFYFYFQNKCCFDEGVVATLNLWI